MRTQEELNQLFDLELSVKCLFNLSTESTKTIKLNKLVMTAIGNIGLVFGYK